MEWELGKRREGGLVSRGRREMWEAEGEIPGGVGVGVSPHVFYRPVGSPSSQNTVSWGLFTLSVCLFFCLPGELTPSFLNAPSIPVLARVILESFVSMYVFPGLWS